MGCDGAGIDFDRLVAAEIPAVLRLAVRLTGDVESAEELVQEALFRAARSRQSFRGDSSLRTWLFKIAIHEFRDGVANRKRRPTEPIVDDLADPRKAAWIKRLLFRICTAHLSRQTRCDPSGR